MDSSHVIVQLAILVLVLYSVSLHEMGHAYVSTWLGDPTPGRYGRLTWNPLAHLKPVSTAILFPFIMWFSSKVLFCLALTPVDPTRWKRPLRDSALVAAAGPAVNFIVAGMLLLVMRIPGVCIDPYSFEPPNYTTIVLPWATYWIFILGVFNLLPIPPLDGYSIVRGLIPLQMRQKTDELRRSQFSFLIAIVFGSLIFHRMQPPFTIFFNRLLPHGLAIPY